jgi:D-alanyl-D-alanine carboxypeptidase
LLIAHWQRYRAALIAYDGGCLYNRLMMKLLFTAAAALMLLCACERGKTANAATGGQAGKRQADSPPAPPSVSAGQAPSAEALYRKRLSAALDAAGIPPDMRAAIEAADADAFASELAAATAGDRYLHLLVDKRHPLDPPDYTPGDLVPLNHPWGGKYRTSREGLLLRREAAEALGLMAEAARADDVTLTASSAYRSFAYQSEVYARNVREMGAEAADRESSRPGHSQHQLGLAVDFGSITDEFARTAAGRWMAANAAAHGWSLSFPDDYEALTGYRWESWHYRYTGVPLAAFIERRFSGLQQYALQFIRAWKEGGSDNADPLVF